MIAVVFEVWPADGKKDEYMAHAASLHDELHGMDGYLGREIPEPD